MVGDRAVAPVAQAERAVARRRERRQTVRDLVYRVSRDRPRLPDDGGRACGASSAQTRLKLRARECASSRGIVRNVARSVGGAYRQRLFHPTGHPSTPRIRPWAPGTAEEWPRERASRDGKMHAIAVRCRVGASPTIAPHVRSGCVVQLLSVGDHEHLCASRKRV